MHAKIITWENDGYSLLQHPNDLEIQTNEFVN